MKKKHIVHLISSLKVGGAEMVLVSLIKNLDSSHKNTVIYFHDGPNRKVLEEKGVKVISIKGLLSIYDPLFFIRLIRCIRQLTPDVIHSSLWSANVAGRIVAKWLDIPILCAIHSSTNLARRGRRNSLFREHVDRALAHWADKYVLVSSTIQFPFIPSTKSLVINNGVIPAQKTRREELMNHLGIEEDDFVVGSVGRLSPVKNFSLLIEAFAGFHGDYPKSKLIIVGYGDEEDKLRALIKRLNLEGVAVLIEASPAIDYYSLFNVFAMTSWQEGLSIALLEAMSVGCAPVVVQPDGVHEVLEHKVNGWLVRKHEPREVTGALKELLLDRSLYTQLSDQAERTVQNKFTIQKMVVQYSELYQDLSTK